MELPFQTYERITHRRWPGGANTEIAKALLIYGIEYKPGTAEANLCLQGAMLCNEMLHLKNGLTTIAPGFDKAFTDQDG